MTSVRITFRLDASERFLDNVLARFSHSENENTEDDDSPIIRIRQQISIKYYSSEVSLGYLTSEEKQYFLQHLT